MCKTPTYNVQNSHVKCAFFLFFFVRRSRYRDVLEGVPLYIVFPRKIRLFSKITFYVGALLTVLFLLELCLFNSLYPLFLKVGLELFLFVLCSGRYEIIGELVIDVNL